jgi:tight adherence protein B
VTAAVALGWAAWMGSARLRVGRPAAVAVLTAVTLRAPLLGVAGVAVVAARLRWRRAVLESASDREEAGEVALLADLLVVALTAGLSLRAAFEAAGAHLESRLADGVARLIAEMDRVGAAPALASAEGVLADIGRVAAGAAASGAPVAAALAGFASARRHAAHAEHSAAARRLPVRLLLPLALLILPGFVVLAVGPALLQALARLSP